jgi:uncharacterized membrane protein
MREEYVSPVGFAKEPSEERRRWIGRIFLILLVVFVVWLFLYRVLNPADEGNPVLNGGPQQQETVLPAPE